ncbi:MAG: M15 family metallopeptidase [Oceanicoccus sp.]
MQLDKLVLCGLNDHFIDYECLSHAIHQRVLAPFQALRDAADTAGFELAIASGYRDFPRQLAIWNDKVAGRRPVFDVQGLPLDVSVLDHWQLVQAILKWSALPGASRHHWGSDIDIFDKAAVPKDFDVQLTAAEVSGDGPFVALHNWLDIKIDNNDAEGFFRPYLRDVGGIAPERWHLSYAPLAAEYQRALNQDYLVDIISEQPILLKEVLLEHIDEIYHRYIVVDKSAYPEAYRW